VLFDIFPAASEGTNISNKSRAISSWNCIVSAHSYQRNLSGNPAQVRPKIFLFFHIFRKWFGKLEKIFVQS